MPLLIFIYSIMGQVICKYEPFRQDVSAVSYTQVTVNACGTFVIILTIFDKTFDFYD